MDSWEQFKKRREITRVAENTKFGVVVLLLISVFVLEVMDDATAKAVIWYWVGLMVILLAICVTQDIINHIKIKRAGL